MSRPEIKLDEHGFPIPEKYSEDQPKRRGVYKNGNPFQKPWVKALVLVVILFAVATMLLKDHLPEMVAQWYLQAAAEDLQRQDYESALTNLEGVIAWKPEDHRAYYLRGVLYREMGDFDAALDELGKAIELQDGWLEPVSLRASINLRLKRFPEAVADNSRALMLSGESDEAMFRNNRAYARALGGFELEAGLQDVEAAIASKEKDLEYDPRAPFVRLDLSAYLDTRGFLHHLLGKQEQALEDLNRALSLIDEVQSESPFRSLVGESPQQLRRSAAVEQSLNESRAVMHEHRALVYEKLGKPEEAARDHETAKQYGYAPDAGVF
ncbi:MAG: tetratricopeptide repeat protein [Pirellulales bacterium]|nr:tetratricopeptide repeat protein [Pirellulales bacterium]